MTASLQKSNIFSIPPTQPFLDCLASNLLNEYQNNLDELADILILLPTRRTCRNLQNSFLRISKGKSLLLPKIQPIGDVDAQELSLSLPNNHIFELAPSISTIKRQLLISKLIAAKKPEQSGGIEQDLGLAQALAQLIDEIHTEDLDFKNLPQIVEKQEVAEHWQITLSFLEIISVYWPQILGQFGYSDASQYRNILLSTLNQYWQENLPSYPVIMAGSTASIPAVSNLAKTIASMPKGKIILPGLDKYMNQSAWDNLEEGHPQATLKNLLNSLNTNRNDVVDFSIQNKNQTTRLKFISNVMLPAVNTDQWSDKEDEEFKALLYNDIEKNIFQYQCDNLQEEADLIALILRETLEDSIKTACVITTNRALSRRIIQRCKMWDIILDDTAGQNLKDTPLGQYLDFSLSIFTTNFDSISLLRFLKHDYTKINTIQNFRQKVRDLEINLLRGKPIHNGFEGLFDRYHSLMKSDNYKKPSEDTLLFLEDLKENLNSFIEFFKEKEIHFNQILKAHLELSAHFFGYENTTLWSGEAGKAASELFSEIQEFGDDIGKITITDYQEIINHFVSGITIRPKFGTHPRVQILGQIEGRMVQADRVILAGLNEGSWPKDPGHDPWMSRPMREKFGLPSPERSITLSSHDFTQAFCAPEVYLTRSIKLDGAPTVPSRWLERMRTYLEALNINVDILNNGQHLNYLSHLDNVEEIIPINRPAPCPPLSARPTQLSVTYIDRWMQDPYSIYAKKVLKLEKLAPLNEAADAADKGIIFHDILHRFNKKYPKYLSDKSVDDFVTIALETLSDHQEISQSLSFWKPRLINFAKNYIEFEKNWRQQNQLITAEIIGKIDFNSTENIDFILTARVDRIDRHADGNYAIIDYKSGGQYSYTDLKTGALSQLPLEGLILTQGNYENLNNKDKKAGYLGYWKIENSKQSIVEIKTKSFDETHNSIEETKIGLINLITTYQNPETAYLAIPDLNNAPRFNDYAYLERVLEWAALDDNEFEAA